MKPKLIELCAGAGGLALGLERAGFSNVLMVEKDKWACESLKANFGSKCGRILNEDINVFLNQINSYRNTLKNIDLLAAGLPCQAFSFAGKKRGFLDPRGNLFFTFFRILRVLKPKICLIENVKGLLTHDRGKVILTVRKEIERLGYKVKYKILNAWDYGVAQKRERVFIVGFQNEQHFNKFQFPEKAKIKLVLKDVLTNTPVSEFIKYSSNKKLILDLVPPGGCWRNLPVDVAKSYMKGSYFLSGGKTGIARRLSWNEPSLTLTTSPVQKQTERCHPDETRPFTIKEYARIQSFPDSWIFKGSIYNQYRQIGNAVPVNLAHAIGKAIKQTLD